MALICLIITYALVHVCKDLYTDNNILIYITIHSKKYNQKNKFTNTQFFEEFSTFLQDRVTSSGDLLIVGDLNFHLDKKNDTSTRKLTELLESFNILQCVNTSTQMSGHTLDVIMCRATDNLIQPSGQMYVQCTYIVRTSPYIRILYG